MTTFSCGVNHAITLFRGSRYDLWPECHRTSRLDEDELRAKHEKYYPIESRVLNEFG